jgi:hypothetical protein
VAGPGYNSRMTPLDVIADKIAHALPRLNLRPTIDRAAEVGELLVRAKSLLPHGEFLPWCQSVGLSRQSASDYMAVHRHRPNDRPAGHLGIKEFLQAIRSARHQHKQAEREKLRAEYIAERGKHPKNIRLVHADCREYGWPVVDGVCTDPPWDRMDLYEWLGTWAVRHVRPGGFVLVQCSTVHLPRVANRLTDGGLTYVWTLAAAFALPGVSQKGGFRPTWLPILVFAVPPAVRPAENLTDFAMAKPEPKPLHEWQQPAGPLKYWMPKFFPQPGMLIADPFTGSGTTAVACRELGLRFLGTEIDRKNYRVARGRLARLSKGE